jgi:sugar phosphate permease
MKAILYGFLLWMPTYLKHKGFAREATYAPIVFNAATIVGSTVLGYFYGEKKVLSKS